MRGSRNFVHGVRGNEGRFVFHGEMGYFSLILQLMCQRRGGGADRHPNSPISAHLNVIALFMIVSREITERQDCLSTEARVTR